jgi:hypothetical protein
MTDKAFLDSLSHITDTEKNKDVLKMLETHFYQICDKHNLKLVARNDDNWKDFNIKAALKTALAGLQCNTLDDVTKEDIPYLIDVACNVMDSNAVLQVRHFRQLDLNKVLKEKAK